MKRRRNRLEINLRERLSLILVVVFFVALGSGMLWLRSRLHHEDPTPEIEVARGENARVPLAPLQPGQAIFVNFVSEPEPHRVFVHRTTTGAIQVMFASCRRCYRYGRPTRFSNGRLICGHCRDAMPELKPGEPIPPEPDCTPVPIAHSVQGDAVVIQADAVREGIRSFFAR